VGVFSEEHIVDVCISVVWMQGGR